MSSAGDETPGVEVSARALVAAVRTIVDQIGKANLRMQMQGSEAEKGLHAQAALDALLNPQAMPLCIAHDTLAQP